MTEAQDTIHHAVVGFDGSENSAAALQWAFEHVQRLGGGTIKLVMAWNYSPTAVGGYGLAGGGLPPADSMQEATEQGLAESLASITPPEGITLESVVREGPAAKILVEESEGAEILVVGKRGHGGFLGLLIGSITNQVANHAVCPVVIVPGPEQS